MSAPRVAIIGSFRQCYQAVLTVWNELNAAGIEVTSPLGTPIIQEGVPFVRFESDPPTLDDASVQTIAMHRIFGADATYVVAPKGYVGRTTCYEIGRLIQARHPTYFSTHPADLPVAIPASHVITTDDFIEIANNNLFEPLTAHEKDLQQEWESALVHGRYLDL